MVTAYRVYLSDGGDGLSYCGERGTINEARALARRQLTGEPQSLWATRRAAGGTDVYLAPDAAGTEDDEACDWVADYAIVRTKY
jgi:hypothetical protein